MGASPIRTLNRWHKIRTPVDQSPVDPASVIALVGLGGSGVMALWRIANGLGKFEAKTSTILNAMQVMLQDHEERIRAMESRR